MLTTVTGASGVGKTSLLRMALEKIPNIRFLRSVTTRPKRDGDLPGEYDIFTEEAWRVRLVRGEYAWHINFSGFLYGTLREDVREALTSPHPYLAALVPERIPSVHDLARSFGLSRNLNSVYIFSPLKSVLRERMLGRGEEPAKVEERLKASQGWDLAAKREKRYSAFIRDNNDLEAKFSDLRSFLHHPR